MGRIHSDAEVRKSEQETRKYRGAINWETKMRDVHPVKDKRINKCYDLIGKEVIVEVVAEQLKIKKKAVITRLFPYYAEAVYKAGPDNQYEFKCPLNIADLIEKNCIRFDNGYPEVI